MLISGYTSSSHSISGVGDLVTKSNITTGISVNIDEFDHYDYRGPRAMRDSNRSIDMSGVIAPNDLTFCLREVCSTSNLVSIQLLIFFVSSVACWASVSARR
jgi:uncharacterized protein (UPF0218 family)